MKIVIIGGESSGIEVAKNIRSLNSEVEIVVIEKNKYVSYMLTAMPYYISGMINEKDLIIDTIDELEKKYNIKVLIETEVIDILKDTKELKLLNRGEGNIYKISYDKLVLSLGTLAKKTEEFDNLGENVFIHKTLQNALRLKKYLERKNPKSCAIFGSGAIALQLAENLNKMGIKVTVLEKANKIMPRYDKDITDKIEYVLEEYIDIIKDINILKVSDKSVKSEETEEDILQIEYTYNNTTNTDAEILNVNFAIVNIGNIPGTKFVKKAGIKTNEDDYIIVDEYMKTSVNDIYAVGDCVAVRSKVKSNLNVEPRLSNSGNKEAYIVAKNILGDSKAYSGTTNTMLTSTFGIYLGRTGLSENTILKNKIDYYIKQVVSTTSDRIFNNSEEITIKGLFEKNTQKLLGATVVGRRDVNKKIDVLSTSISSGYTACDLAMLELAYMPRNNKSQDIINILGVEGEKSEKNTSHNYR